MFMKKIAKRVQRHLYDYWPFYFLGSALISSALSLILGLALLIFINRQS